MMNFKKEWSDDELDRVVNVFSKWEKKNLTITYGKRERTTEDTYGLPYTSSSDYAMISNTNVKAVLNTGKEFNFDYLALTEDNEVVAMFENNDNEEKSIVIGRC
jgi:hypothetical protein